MNPRACPFHGCDERVPAHIFACRRHWFSLCRADRAEIQSAYDDYTADRIGVEELRRRQQEILGGRGTA